MANSKTGEPSHRLRLSKLWKKNCSESNLSHLGPELVPSDQERPVCQSPTPPAQFRFVLTLVSQHSTTPSLQCPPRFFKKVASFFKRPEEVFLAHVDGSILLTDPTSITLLLAASLATLQPRSLPSSCHLQMDPRQISEPTRLKLIRRSPRSSRLCPEFSVQT